MTVDLNLYRRTIKPLIKIYMDRHIGENVSKCLGDIASDTYCPIIAVACFAAEIYGMNPDFQRVLDSALTFYGATVINRLDLVIED